MASLSRCVIAGCEVSILTGQPITPTVRCSRLSRAVDAARDLRGHGTIRVPLVPRGNASALRLVCNYLSFIAS